MKSTIQAFADGARLVGDLGRFVWRRKVWWLVPMLILLLLAIVLTVLGQTPLAPFIYTLF